MESRIEPDSRLGLQTNTAYTFQLILKTTAGTLPSNVVHVKTHTLEDTSGISVCFGTILDSDVGEGKSVWNPFNLQI
jgi:Fibronectin type III domain